MVQDIDDFVHACQEHYLEQLDPLFQYQLGGLLVSFLQVELLIFRPKLHKLALFVLPDGKPLSVYSRKHGFPEAERVTGPDLMLELFARENGLKHYFYGGSPETLQMLEQKLRERYPHLQIAGMVSPPFRSLSEKEDAAEVEKINASGADIIWVGLGAPKQENWMYDHRDKVHGVMIGVGAGFDYHAGNIKRAPMWMQKLSLEWLYRLMQDPKRLFKRYLVTNTRYLWLTRTKRQ